jgi:hypothetical protein
VRYIENIAKEYIDDHKALIHHGHSVKRTCPFRHGRVEENKLVPLYENNENKLKHFFV